MSDTTAATIDVAEWTEGIMSDGAVILRDGVPVGITDLLTHLNCSVTLTARAEAAEKERDCFVEQIGELRKDARYAETQRLMAMHTEMLDRLAAAEAATRAAQAKVEVLEEGLEVITGERHRSDSSMTDAEVAQTALCGCRTARHDERKEAGDAARNHSS